MSFSVTISTTLPVTIFVKPLVLDMLNFLFNSPTALFTKIILFKLFLLMFYHRILKFPFFGSTLATSFVFFDYNKVKTLVLTPTS